MENKFYSTFLSLCEKKGVKKTKACIEALGKTGKNSYSRWENGTADPRLDSLLKLSKYFGVTLDELVYGEKPATESDGQSLTENQRDLIRLIPRLTDREVEILLLQVKGIILGQRSPGDL